MQNDNDSICLAKPKPYNENNICLFSYGSSKETSYRLQFSGYYNNSIGVAAGGAILLNHEDKILWN